MNKKCGMFYVFSFYFFLLLSNQHVLGVTAVINPVADMLGVAATAVVDIAHNAYQGYLEKNRKEDLEKAKQQLLSIKTDLQTLEGLGSESLTCQFLRQYSYPQTQNVSANEVLLLEKQVNEIQNLLVLHLNQLIENVDWIRTLYQNAMVEITKVMDVWNSNSHVITPDIACKVYENYLFREHLITRVHSVFDELLVISRYYRACKNESIKLIVTNIAVWGQIVSIVEAKKSWLSEEERQARNNSAILERYFANQNISVSTFKDATQKEFAEEFKNRDTDLLKKLAIQQQANSGFAGGPRKDDDEDFRQPFGRYEDAPYHTKTSSFVKSKAPSNGQKALDNSVSIGQNTPWRIGISDSEIVVLDQTSPRLFHGHVRLWKDLTQEMKNALVDAGLCTLKGKIK